MINKILLILMIIIISGCSIIQQDVSINPLSIPVVEVIHFNFSFQSKDVLYNMYILDILVKK
jgi:uncharacterized protein YceK